MQPLRIPKFLGVVSQDLKTSVTHMSYPTVLSGSNLLERMTITGWDINAVGYSVTMMRSCTSVYFNSMFPWTSHVSRGEQPGVDSPGRDTASVPPTVWTWDLEPPELRPWDCTVCVAKAVQQADAEFKHHCCSFSIFKCLAPGLSESRSCFSLMKTFHLPLCVRRPWSAGLSNVCLLSEGEQTEWPDVWELGFPHPHHAEWYRAAMLWASLSRVYLSVLEICRWFWWKKAGAHWKVRVYLLVWWFTSKCHARWCNCLMKSRSSGRAKGEHSKWNLQK